MVSADGIDTSKKRIGIRKKMSRSWERALYDSEESLSAVDCSAVHVFLKEAGEGSDLGVGFKNGVAWRSGLTGLLSSDVAKQWSLGGCNPP